MASRTSDDYRKRMRAREDKPAYMRGLTRPVPATHLTCPCCGAEQPPHSAIAYCDDCNDDTCGHQIPALDETPMMMFWCVEHRAYETEGCGLDE